MENIRLVGFICCLPHEQQFQVSITRKISSAAVSIVVALLLAVKSASDAVSDGKEVERV